jgi:hypothetical protein
MNFLLSDPVMPTVVMAGWVGTAYFANHITAFELIIVLITLGVSIPLGPRRKPVDPA